MGAWGGNDDDFLILGAALSAGGTSLTVTLAGITLIGIAAQVRKSYGTVFCRQHRVFYVLDDRFPAPCAKYGGHEPAQPGA